MTDGRHHLPSPMPDVLDVGPVTAASRTGHLPGEDRGDTTVDAILAAVAALYNGHGVTVERLTGLERVRPLPEARGVAARVLHDDGLMSWAAVCAALNRTYGGWIIEQANKAPAVCVVAVRRLLYGGGQAA